MDPNHPLSLGLVTSHCTFLRWQRALPKRAFQNSHFARFGEYIRLVHPATWMFLFPIVKAYVALLDSLRLISHTLLQKGSA